MYDEVGYDKLTTALALPDGGVVLGGYSDSPSSGNKKTAVYGGNDYFLVNLDQNGAKRGLQCVGGTGDDRLRSLLLTKEGGYLLGGNSDSPKTNDPLGLTYPYKSRSSRGQNFWIVKLNAMGGKEWDLTTGGTGSEYLSSALPTPDGGYLLGALLTHRRILTISQILLNMVPTGEPITGW